MALVYEPGDALVFQKPFQTLRQDALRLTNKNNAPVAFKIKTTAPKLYCVRPNAGRIEPGNGIDVQVVLQPMAEDPPAGKGCRDKFLIQSIQISPEMESMPMTELWAMVEREAKSSISEKKLRVRHLPPVADYSDAAAKSPPTEANKSASAPDALSKKPQQRTPPAARNPPGPSPLAKSVESQGEEESASAKSISPQPQQNQQKTPASSNRLFPDSSAAQSPEDTTTFSNALLPHETETKASGFGDLDKANAAIKDLKQQLSDCKTQLEKARGVNSLTSSGSQKPVAQASSSTDGLSIQSVAIIALVAFLFGYFFF
ncbi:phosphatidylinositol-binding protein scs2 [Coemansia sp. RSA 1646]|nr:phosphatidylinositol-binding protein scs2 [Coemansia sp. RSA 1646]KAJ1772371.1 phosphatidylinositol-binding protein scs2 [Coemansia sp. RSA 1843]KAJ2212134.1 phosphatidylinositol-binding protein scs2 [Coemansia sp. RSA 487]